MSAAQTNKVRLPHKVCGSLTLFVMGTMPILTIRGWLINLASPFLMLGIRGLHLHDAQTTSVVAVDVNLAVGVEDDHYDNVATIRVAVL